LTVGYPAADASGLIEVLSLYGNNNAQWVSFYVGKDAPIVAVGVWEAGSDHPVSVTLTGQPGQDYRTPAIVVYTQEGDTLVDGNLVPTRPAEVTPAAMDARNVPMPADAPPVQRRPRRQRCSASTSSYILKGAVTKVGAWEVDASNVLTLTFTGSAGKAYDAPAVTVYQVDGESLVDGPFVLGKLRVVPPSEMEAATASDETATYNDPFAYCAAVGAVDEPDDRCTGPALPVSIAEGLRTATGASADAPMKNSVWRCAEGRVMVSTVDANRPCTEKAKTSATPNKGIVAFGKDNPDAEVAPATPGAARTARRRSASSF